VSEDEEPGGWRVTHHAVDYDRRVVLEAFESSGMLAAGGIISRLFYWEICTAQPEIVLLYRWCWESGFDPDEELVTAFAAYKADSVLNCRTCGSHFWQTFMEISRPWKL
jgi:hypothetical protein